MDPETCRREVGIRLNSDDFRIENHLLNWIEIRMEAGLKSDHVFVVLENTPYCSVFYGKPFKHRQHFMERVCRRAKVGPFCFHAIRHFTASYLYQKGYPVSVIQQILRHKNPNTTTRYLRKLGLEIETVRAALEDIPKKNERAEVILLKQKYKK